MIINQIPLSDFNEAVYLTAYLHTREPNRFEPELVRPAIIICPGGAYMGINEAEAEYLSLQFMAAGFQTFVLNYSIGAPYARFPMPINDLEKAYEHVVSNLDHYMIAEGQIIVCGLSAGAHLASLVSARFDAAILIHPILDLNLISDYGRMTNEATNAMVDMMFTALFGNSSPSHDTLLAFSSISHINSNTPPTLIVKSMLDDWSTHAQVVGYAEACYANGVEAKVITTAQGTHGDYTGPWIHDALTWFYSHFKI